MPADRIAACIALAPEPRDRGEMIAARHLYSTLAHLEQIAVMAAERGDGTPGQLEDEIAHQGTFRALARDLGGIVPPARETAELVEALRWQRGAASRVLLNLVCETWLDTVFAWLGAPGWGDRLFRAVEADEARHVEDAWHDDLPDADLIEQPVRVIEEALVGIAMSPAFMVPIVHLRGADMLARIGLDALARHAEVCVRLGLRPGPATWRLEAMCRAVGRVKWPRPVTVTEGRRALLLSPVPLPMHTEFTIPLRSRLPTAALARAALGVLAAQPHLRRVARRDQVWQHAQPRVAVRVPHPEGIGTVIVEGELETDTSTARAIAVRAQRLRLRPYPRAHDLADLIDILPPPVASVAVTSATGCRFETGQIPLVPAEGIPIVAGISLFGDGQACVGLTMDHRLYDPPDLALLRDGLITRLRPGFSLGDADGGNA